MVRSLSARNPDGTGPLTIGDQPMTPRRSKEFYRRVQMVFQDPYGSLHPRQTVDRLLSEPSLVHRLDNVDRRHRADLDALRVVLQRLPRQRQRFLLRPRVSEGGRQIPIRVSDVAARSRVYAVRLGGGWVRTVWHRDRRPGARRPSANRAASVFA